MNPFNNTPDNDAALERIITSASSVRRLTKDEVLRAMPEDVLARIVDRIGGDLFVVLSDDGRSLLADPATRAPFRHNNRKFAELVAKEIGGVVTTYSDAIKTLTNKAQNQ